MTSRRLSQLAGSALAALVYWDIVSQPDVGSGNVVIFHLGIAAVTLAMLGALFLMLRWVVGGSAIYWSTTRVDQVWPVGWMILSISTALLVGYCALALANRLDPFALTTNYLIATTLAPLFFLLSGRVKWPTRLAYPGKLWLAFLWLSGIGVSSAWAWWVWSSLAPGQSPLPPVERILFIVPVTVLGATMEEIVFRVLLLTAVLDRTGSRFQAVFLSSVAFGLMHVPGQFIHPVSEASWAVFQATADRYAQEFLIQVMLGLFISVLWLRSGSITLIALTHTLFNLGGDLALSL